MKNKYIYITLITILSLFVVAAKFGGDDEKVKTNKDILIFSHQFHIENEIECDACHASSAEATELKAGLLPTMDACADCHDVEDEEECSTCHYEDIQETYLEKSFTLFFDHKYHVENKELECAYCHSGLDKVDYAFESKTSVPSMAVCSNCHNNTSEASNNCESCHKSTAELLPDDHKVVDFRNNHQFAGIDDQDCAVCHDNNFCETCHTATVMITEPNTNSDFYTPYSPHKLKNNVKQQQITLVHDLNYRFTHGIEARGKSQQCQTCHQPETFCVECHSSTGGDYAMGGIVPFSHTVSNFTTLGVGSGGGEHAILAKRDMESCIACHDIEGNDPSCIMCHVDYDGVKGTNPKTHEMNFMHDSNGDWHDDDGSVCYNCHTRSVTAGVGFCNYCHGNK